MKTTVPAALIADLPLSKWGKVLGATPVVLTVIATMLAEQLGVIVSTLAIAARQRNLPWSLAAAAGSVAVTFAADLYWYV